MWLFVVVVLGGGVCGGGGVVVFKQKNVLQLTSFFKQQRQFQKDLQRTTPNRSKLWFSVYS